MIVRHHQGGSPLRGNCRTPGRGAGGTFNARTFCPRLLGNDGRRPHDAAPAAAGMPPAAVVPSTRSARIDFLRGVAIFAVLLLHFSLTYQLADSPLSLILPAALLRAAV